MEHDGDGAASDDLARLKEELAGVERRVQRRIDPGPIQLALTAAMLVLILSLAMPWTGDVPGWRILAGSGGVGALPQLFTFTSLGFGLVVSSLALATRWWALAWATAVGCGISVVNGVWAIWSRQTGVLTGGTGPAAGMIVAVLAVIVLTACWVRIAGRRA